MSHNQLVRFFEHVAEHWGTTEPVRERPSATHDFVWHGGEPLLLGADYYAAVFDLQQSILRPAGITWTNSVQTNLFRLRTEDIALLRRFDNIGVSVDVMGDLRRDMRGRAAQATVLAHMERLFAENVRFGCIAVLSRQNIGAVEVIDDFFKALAVSYRLLPIYRTGFTGQTDPMALTADEIRSCFQRLFDRWVADGEDRQVRPILDYAAIAIRQLLGGTSVMGQYGRKTSESLFIVNTDGQVYSNADAYAPDYAYGSVFAEPVASLLSSAGFQRSQRHRRQRLAEVCSSCVWYGACSGFAIAEATPEQRWTEGGKLYCGVVRPLVEYMANTFERQGLPQHLELAA